MPLSGDFFSAKTLRAEKSVFSGDFLGRANEAVLYAPQESGREKGLKSRLFGEF